MSGRSLLGLATMLFLTAIAAGCGSESSPVLTGTSTAAASSNAATSTTEFFHPWSGNYGTVTDSDPTTPAPPAPTTEFVPVAGGEEYAAKLTSWLENPPIQLENAAGPPSPEDEGYDPMTASHQEVEGWRQYAKLLTDHIGALENIQPPPELAGAHKDFIEGWMILSRYCEELARAVENRDDSALEDVGTTWWDAMNHLIDADWEILDTVGHGVLFN